MLKSTVIGRVLGDRLNKRNSLKYSRQNLIGPSRKTTKALNKNVSKYVKSLEKVIDEVDIMKNNE